jgi:transcriptional antiterminator RfaH
MACWSVVQTEAQREGTAATWLERIGLVTYVPRIKILSYRVDRQGRTQTRSRTVALFPSYLFADLQNFTSYSVIDNTIACIGVLRTGEKPAVIQEDFVNKIKAQERNGLVRLPDINRPRFKYGDRVRISNKISSFADQVGIFQGMGAKERVFVLLDMLGRSVRVDVADADIQPIVG